MDHYLKKYKKYKAKYIKLKGGSFFNNRIGIDKKSIISYNKDNDNCFYTYSIDNIIKIKFIPQFEFQSTKQEYFNYLKKNIYKENNKFKIKIKQLVHINGLVNNTKLLENLNRLKKDFFIFQKLKNVMINL